MGGTGDDAGLAIAVDFSGAVYANGYFQGIADFNPGAAVSNFASAGDYDGFVTKLDAVGNLVWAKAIGGIGTDVGRAIEVSNAGAVYSAGTFMNTVDFNPGSPSHNTAATGDRDIFVQKLNTDGTFSWAGRMGESLYDTPTAIALDSTGSVYHWHILWLWRF